MFNRTLIKIKIHLKTEKTMKKNTYFLLLITILLLTSCDTKKNKMGDFNTLPVPQNFEIKGLSALGYEDVDTYYSYPAAQLPVFGDILQHLQSTDDESEAQILFNLDESLDMNSEGYIIDISANQIKLTGKDKPGLFYALKTLEQLLEDAVEQDVYLPLCSIRDFPELSYRAVHLDMKHHLEQREYYYKLIDKLASYKVNAIIAEIEDKIKYQRQPILGASDALSITEWKKLSNYANERNIEISPLIQGLGHASFILKHEKYTGLRDDPQSDWAFNPLDPETYKVQFDLYLDAMEATPHGKYLHVGGDEVHTTGRGSKKSALELQLNWLNKVCKFAEDHGRVPIFWDDMPLKHAGVYTPMFNTELTKKEVEKIWEENEHKLIKFLDHFPKNCIYMRWNYSSPQAVGNTKAMDWFRKNGLQVMGATAGQTRWVLMPQNESNIDNIKTFALSSIESDLNGLLLTLWDDDSPHFELYSRGILAFAEYTWAGNKRSKETFKAAYRHREFSSLLADNSYSFIDRLENPVSFYKNALLTGNRRNYLKQHKNPVEELVIDLPGGKEKGAWSTQYEQRLQQAAKVSKRCDSLALKMQLLKSKAVRNTYALDVYEQVNELVRFTAQALLTLQAFDQSETEQQEQEILKKLKLLPEEFLVLRENFEGVYAKTRVLSKPDDYILDQDHHVHLANQTISFDWQFLAEIMFLKKLKTIPLSD